jgi:hypothetical protein
MSIFTKKPWYRRPATATIFHGSLLAHLLVAVVWNLTNPRRTSRGTKTALFAGAMSLWEIGSVRKNWLVWRSHRGRKLQGLSKHELRPPVVVAKGSRSAGAF